jgi:hypothetical protein
VLYVGSTNENWFGKILRSVFEKPENGEIFLQNKIIIIKKKKQKDSCSFKDLGTATFANSAKFYPTPKS